MPRTDDDSFDPNTFYDGPSKSQVKKDALVLQMLGESLAALPADNFAALKIDDRGYIEVISVRPCQRLNSDGFTLRETVCEYVQIAKLFAAECNSVLGFKHLPDMRTTQPLEVYGGGVLIFDQYGRIKFHVAQRLNEVSRQKPRLEYLWNNGYIDRVADRRNRFALLHRRRALG